VERQERAAALDAVVAKPRTSRTVSADPRDPWTVEKRTNTGVSTDVSQRNSAVVRSESDS